MVAPKVRVSLSPSLSLTHIPSFWHSFLTYFFFNIRQAAPTFDDMLSNLSSSLAQASETLRQLDESRTKEFEEYEAFQQQQKEQQELDAKPHSTADNPAPDVASATTKKRADLLRLRPSHPLKRTFSHSFCFHCLLCVPCCSPARLLTTETVLRRSRDMVMRLEAFRTAMRIFMRAHMAKEEWNNNAPSVANRPKKQIRVPVPDKC